MKPENEKIIETMLVLTTGLLVVYLLTGGAVFLYLSVFLGLTAIFVKPLAALIAAGWLKLAHLLGFISSGIILSVLFFAMLFPVSFVYRVRHGNKLALKKPANSNWLDRNKNFGSGDLQNTW